MSTVVASVALVFSYRQNVGWKPILLALEASVGDDKVLRLRIEFWNRRKYPLTLTYLYVGIDGIDLDSRTIFTKLNYQLVAPDSSVTIPIEAKCKSKPDDKDHPRLFAMLTYFNSYKGREQDLTIRHALWGESAGTSDSYLQKTKTFMKVMYNRHGFMFVFSFVVPIFTAFYIAYDLWKRLR